MVIHKAVVKGYVRIGMRAKHAGAGKRSGTVIADAMTGRRMGVVLNSARNRGILRRLPVRKDDHVTLAAVDILGGPSPLGRGEIIGIIGLYPGRIVSAKEGGRNLG